MSGCIQTKLSPAQSHPQCRAALATTGSQARESLWDTISRQVQERVSSVGVRELLAGVSDVVSGAEAVKNRAAAAEAAMQALLQVTPPALLIRMLAGRKLMDVSYLLPVPRHPVVVLNWIVTRIVKEAQNY